MPVFQLPQEIAFPDPEQADEDGLVAVGGDLRPERVLTAYALGIFPWPHDDMPLLWFSPDPRLVLRTGELHVSHSLARTLRKGRFEVRLDTAFEEVIRACARAKRKGQGGTWITPEMVDAYCALHELGFAHSTEAWLDDELVGGAYGIALGDVFTGESMFAGERDASKVAFVGLVRQLERWGVGVVDCQVATSLLESFGATEWPRRDFLAVLRASVSERDRIAARRGRWVLDADLAHPSPP